MIDHINRIMLSFELKQVRGIGRREEARGRDKKAVLERIKKEPRAKKIIVFFLTNKTYIIVNKLYNTPNTSHHTQMPISKMQAAR